MQIHGRLEILCCADGGFQQIAFNLTPSASTTCGSVDPSLPPEQTGVDCGGMPSPAHICIRCSGQFVVALMSPSAGPIHVDYVYLVPGEWGRFQGLPVLKSAAENLQEMGIKVIRQGGIFVSDGDGYDWKLWRGPPWERGSLGWVWKSSLIGGWGPFELADMCQAIGAEMVYTVAAPSSHLRRR